MGVGIKIVVRDLNLSSIIAVLVPYFLLPSCNIPTEMLRNLKWTTWFIQGHTCPHWHMLTHSHTQYTCSHTRSHTSLNNHYPHKDQGSSQHLRKHSWPAPLPTKQALRGCHPHSLTWQFTSPVTWALSPYPTPRTLRPLPDVLRVPLTYCHWADFTTALGSLERVTPAPGRKETENPW